jgi:ribonuclease BN (tRNA processing enzyme)
VLAEVPTGVATPSRSHLPAPALASQLATAQGIPNLILTHFSPRDDNLEG